MHDSFLARCLAGAATLINTCVGAEPEPPPPLDYYIVVTGGELLEGAYPDGHTHFLTRTLRPLGLRCLGSLVADDRRPDLIEALRFATNRASLVLVTGGLGPTPNDITRETLSECTAIPLREEETVLAAMERRFGQPREQLRANLRKQCLVPSRGAHLKNASGTAVGLVFTSDGATVVALPGPPRELQPMVRDELVPWLRARFGLHRLGASVTLRFVGVGQSQVAQTLQERVRLPEDIVVTSLFEGSRVDFTFTSPRDTAEDRAILRRIAGELRAQLDEFCYGEDGTTLEQIVLRGLRARGVRLALAEAASGGALSASLCTESEAAPVLAGSFAAPNAAALAAILSVPTERWPAPSSAEDQARVLAEAAARHAKAEWGIAVGERRPLASGSAEVWIAVHQHDGRPATYRLTTRSDGGFDPATIVTPVLDRVRRLLEAPP